MADRLTLTGGALLLAAAGLFLIFQGLSARVGAMPSETAATMAGNLGPGSSTGVEWQTLQADRRLAPALDGEGAVSFHAGIGLAAAAWALAFFGLARASGVGRWVSLVWLLPAAWALWVIAARAGPAGELARAAMDVFRVFAPVYGFFLLLGLYFFRPDRQPGS